jgi:AsmA protein
MRPIKVLLWIIGGLVGLFVIAMCAVLLLVDPNDFKDEIATAVKDKTGRELALQGELKLSVFPWLALQAGPAQLGNAPGFATGPFLSLEHADVGVRLFPLLRGRMEVRRLELEGLRVYLEKNAQGKGNWEDLAKGESTPAADSGASSEMPSIAGVTIKDAALDYRDLQTAKHWRLQKLDVETGRIEKGKPIDLDMGFVLDEGENTDATQVKLKTSAALDPEAERYTLADLELDAARTAAAPKVKNAPAQKEAREQKVTLRAPSAIADLKAQTLSLPEFTLNTAGAEFTGSVEGKEIVDKPAFTGVLSLKPVNARELLAQLGGETPKTRDPDALKTLAFEAKLAASSSNAMFEDLKLTLDDTHATGRAGIADFEKTALRFDLNVDRINLDRYLAPEEEKKKAEKAAAKEPFELPVDTLKSLNAKGTLRIGELILAGVKMKDVRFNVDAADGLVRLNPSEAKLYGGKHQGAVTIDARGDTAKVSMEQKINAVDLAGLMRDLVDSKRLAGKGSANWNLTARGNDSKALLESLDGRLNFDVADGAIKGTDLWYELRRAQALFRKEAAPAQGSTGETRFKTLKGSAQVENGVVDSRDFVMETDNLAGTLSLPTQKVDYHLTATVYRAPEQGAGAEMQSLKSTEIPVRVSGTLADLKVRPDVQAEVKQQLSEKLTDKLSEWLGKKKKD